MAYKGKCAFLSDLPSLSDGQTSDTAAIVVGVIAIILLVIFIVIVVVLSGYIIHLKR